MAFPAAIAGVGLVASAGGAITSAIGSVFQGQAQAAQYNYQAGVARVNQTLAQQDANYALAAGEVEAQQQGMKTRAEVGLTRAVQGASNVDVNTGSSSQVVKSEIEIGQENEALVRADAAKRAFGYNVEAAKQGAQAGVYTSAAKTSIEAGQLGAVSSILGGVGSVSSKWLQGQSQGVFPSNQAVGDFFSKMVG